MPVKIITDTLPWILGFGGVGVIGWLIYQGVIKPMKMKLPKLMGKKQVIGTNKNQNEAIAFMLSLDQRFPVETNTPKQQRERERQMIDSGFNSKLIGQAQKVILKQKLNVRLENAKGKSKLGQEQTSRTSATRDDRSTEDTTRAIRRDETSERERLLQVPSPDDSERDKRESKRVWRHGSTDR